MTMLLTERQPPIERVETITEYEEAMERLEELMDSDPETGTAEGRELLRLTDLIQAYESRHFRVSRPLNAQN
jgi:HTH-type transcriptional regulator/antitoxin HigA